MKASPLHRRARPALLLVVLLQNAAVAGSPPAPAMDTAPVLSLDASQPGAWRFSAGYLWRQVGTLRWQSHSSIRSGTLPFLLPAGRSSPSSAGETGPLENHHYQDGYVRPDAATARDGDTWNWGYEGASQIEGGSLSFHGTSSSAASSTTERPSVSQSIEHDLESSGISLALDSPGMLLRQDAWLGLTLGYNLVRDDATQDSRGYAARQRSRLSVTRLTDRYDAGGIILPLAPYQGSPEGPGPLIKATPARSTHTATRRNEALLSSRIEQTLELDLHTLSLGPVLHWQPAPRLLLNLSTGLAINIASWEATQTETLTVTRTTRTSPDNRSKQRSSPLSKTRHKDSDTDALPGVYVAGTAHVLLNANWSLFATGRYDWADDLNFVTGPSRGSLDLEGWSVQAGLAYGF